jgi:hypothetical protein
MFLNKATINATATANSGAAFEGWYWSSTELSDINATSIASSDGSKGTEPKSGTIPKTRAIRAF